MVHGSADLAHFIQRRELLAYEQRMARASYAYGVDLRRSQWLEDSNLGEPVIRTVDRRWPALVEGLAEDTLLPSGAQPPDRIMGELARTAHRLRAPLPGLRLLRPEARAREPWPVLTPLGTTRGSVQWLVLDAERLLEFPEDQRTFLLGSAIGHLQCDHGPLFAAHLLAHRAGRGLFLVRTLLGPWSKVAVFSADRAGLLTADGLEPALAAMSHTAGDRERIAWMPKFPPFDVRERALRDFDRSAVVARLRTLQSTRGGHGAEASSESPTGEDQHAWSLARCDEQLTRRLGLL